MPYTMVEMNLQLICLALFPAMLLLTFSSAAPTSNRYAFIKRQYGIGKTECYTMVNHTYAFKKYKLENGVKVNYIETTVLTRKKCCPGYKLNGTHCQQQQQQRPVDPCHNLSCKSEPNARCTIYKKCGREIALFVEDGILVEKCHDPAYLEILSCSGACIGDPCRTAQCPSFNTNEVICFTSGCDCRVTWIRGEDGAEVNCQTGGVLTKQETRQRRKRGACY